MTQWNLMVKELLWEIKIWKFSQNLDVSLSASLSSEHVLKRCEHTQNDVQLWLILYIDDHLSNSKLWSMTAMITENNNNASVSQAPPKPCHPATCPANITWAQSRKSVSEEALAMFSPALNSVPRLWVELCTDVLDDLGDGFVEVVKLIHKEGMVPGRVSGNDVQFILGSPCDAYRIGDHACGDRDERKQMSPWTKLLMNLALISLCSVNTRRPTIRNVLDKAKQHDLCVQELRLSTAIYFSAYSTNTFQHPLSVRRMQ